MRTRVTIALGLALLSLMLAAGAALADHEGEGGVPLSATLTGAAERPGPGHPTATGTASFRLNPGQEEVCFELEVSGIVDVDTGTPLQISGAHIHKAPTTEAGPVVVPLTAPTSGLSGSSSGCTHAPRELILAIIHNPEAYYVNVHATPGFAPGAVRGQLSIGQ